MLDEEGMPQVVAECHLIISAKKDRDGVLCSMIGDAHRKKMGVVEAKDGTNDAPFRYCS